MVKTLTILLVLLTVGTVEAQDYPHVRRDPPPWNWAVVDSSGNVVTGFNGKPLEGLDNVACVKISQSFPNAKCVQR